VAQGRRAKEGEMLDLSDSRNFSRTLSGLGLLGGPLLFFLGSILDPAWADDPVQYLGEVGAAGNRYLLAGVAWSLGSLLLVAGLLGVIKLMRGKGVTLGQVGAGLMCVGAMLFSSTFAFYGIDVALAGHADQEAAATVSRTLDDSAAIGAFFMVTFFGGIVLGSLLLAIALFRRRIVPVWSPALLIASTVGSFAEDQWLNVVSLALLVAAVFPLSAKIRSLTDEAWAQWQPLGEPGPTTVASTPPDPEPA
jgi:hypothetical protein